jgi:hypothetical protein
VNIPVALRFHPFSHTVGMICLLPKSSWQIQAFPTLLRFKNLEVRGSFDVPLQLEGPVKDFTLEQDLERGVVRVFGKSQKGYFIILIEREDEGISLVFEKFPNKPRKEKQLIPLKSENSSLHLSKERLSLGIHKSQDWDLVTRRQLLEEILPFWLRLGMWIPQSQEATRKFGTFTILHECEELIAQKKREEIAFTLHKALLAGFHGILVPRLDDNYEGIVPPSQIPPYESPLPFVSKGAKIIRSLFFQETPGEILLLPFLPPEFHAGRFVHILCENGTEFDIEWSKKILRRVVIRPKVTEDISLSLQKAIRRFRVRTTLKERGTILEKGDKLSLQAGKTLFLDRFEK